MFTHIGKSRTYAHNLKIASLLSFVAGAVNVAGFLSVAQLTTNVTGHFAFFVDEVFKLNFSGSAVFFLYILFFFLGAFSSSLITEIISRRGERYVFVVPTLIEVIILLAIGSFGMMLKEFSPNVIACSLLFAMGLQNSLVTRISGALVRTTHLTGLFTDMGIEISQLFFYREPEQRKRLLSTIRLRLRIISFFFFGGVFGGVFYGRFGLAVLLVPAVLLLMGLLYDSVKYKVLTWSRSHRGNS